MKQYIGSTRNFKERWNTHKKELRGNRHRNAHLQAAWNKYTEASFEFSKILICEVKDLLMYEQLFLDYYKCYDNKIGYNINPVAGSPAGRVTSEETKKKLSIALKGRVMTDEHKRNLSLGQMGRKHSPEHIENRRKSMIGYKPTQESKDKRVESRKGYKHSQETKDKIGLANSGKPLSNEHKQKLSESHKGKTSWNKGIKISDEMRNKMRETRKLNKEKKRILNESIMFEAQSKLQNNNFNI